MTMLDGFDIPLFTTLATLCGYALWWGYRNL